MLADRIKRRFIFKGKVFLTGGRDPLRALAIAVYAQLCMTSPAGTVACPINSIFVIVYKFHSDMPTPRAAGAGEDAG